MSPFQDTHGQSPPFRTCCTILRNSYSGPSIGKNTAFSVLYHQKDYFCYLLFFEFSRQESLATYDNDLVPKSCAKSDTKELRRGLSDASDSFSLLGPNTRQNHFWRSKGLLWARVSEHSAHSWPALLLWGEARLNIHGVAQRRHSPQSSQKGERNE